ncbi:DUF4214 domain-containing protein [Roseovarius sp. D0-M9]|uniref:DUF4214 domain-containing protein n=1 Tax=Roseovarius sp. D0-M9 TaxID=3127117 RepID=UPI00300FCA6D
MPEKILLIGHSLVGKIMPQMLNSVMTTLGRDVQADVQVINGAPLRYNWDNGDRAEGVNARNALADGSYDVVVVTEAIPLDTHLTWNDTHGYATRYYNLATNANSATQFYVYETWHNLGSNLGAWRAQLDDDLGKWEGIADYINAQRAGGMPEALIVPAGQAMARLYDAIQAGQVPGLSSIRDVFKDDIHLNDLGQWFIAGLQAATLAQVSPNSLPAQTVDTYGSPFDAPDAAMTAALTGIIGETLSSYDRDGVSVAGESGTGEGSGTDSNNGGALDNDEVAQIVELYIAYFDRAPDAEGLAFWANEYSKGLSLQGMAALFIDQDETRSMYPDTMSNTALATAVYNNVLGRIPDAKGFDFWVSKLDQGAVGRDTFILSVLEGAKAVTGSAADAAYLETKTDIGLYFAAIKGLSGHADAVSVMDLYDGSPTSVTSAVAEIDQIYAEAGGSTGGDFLIGLIGVIDDPFAAA